jgi:hypothetical protein
MGNFKGHIIPKELDNETLYPLTSYILCVEALSSLPHLTEYNIWCVNKRFNY